jgi:hypothetical protein
MNSRFIIGGDFNAKHTHWGPRLITTKGRELYKAVTDLIDFFVFKNISTNYIKIKEGFDLNSDLTISDKIITKDQNPVLPNRQTGIISTIYYRVILTYQYRLKLLTK